MINHIFAASEYHRGHIEYVPYDISVILNFSFFD